MMTDHKKCAKNKAYADLLDKDEKVVFSMEIQRDFGRLGWVKKNRTLIVTTKRLYVGCKKGKSLRTVPPNALLGLSFSTTD